MNRNTKNNNKKKNKNKNRQVKKKTKMIRKTHRHYPDLLIQRKAGLREIL